MTRSLRSLSFSLGLLSAFAAACGSEHGSSERTGDPPVIPARPGQDWVGENTVALRHQKLSLPDVGAQLSAEALIAQFQSYDPGSLIRCDVHDDPAFRAAVDMLGGVSWGYPVRFLEDESKPEFHLGLKLDFAYPAEAGDGDNDAVEIEKADIVGLSSVAALFYSPSHGLMLVDLSEATPKFKCAAKLPGQVRDFYYYEGHLVAMVGAHLLHFKVVDASLQFVEVVTLDGPVLDTRRFNDRLVVFTSLAKDAVPAATAKAAPAAGAAYDEPYQPYEPPNPHRALQVFKFGETLSEELHHSLRDTTQDDTYFQSQVAENTEPGTLVHTGTFFGDSLWASDHYFVVTESEQKTTLDRWETQYYSVCTRGHTEPRSYSACNTIYETRPNPAYTPPDNSGGDRTCKGTTLSDCLHFVARVSNPTIQVPVRTECKDVTYEDWICDAYESKSHTYPRFAQEVNTRLSIFEYTESGFVRLDSKVNEITNPGLERLNLDDEVDVLTTSDQAFDLSLPGTVQNVYFQGGFLYAISDDVLQVYAMGDSSLVRTSSLQVASNQLQSSLFSDEKLYLSDYGYAGISDYSTLRVVDLANPAFPHQVSQDQTLPGGHTSILPTSQGILTVGSVSNFEGTPGTYLKLGLFADPVTTEKAYLILGTDLQYNRLITPEAHYFDRAQSRMFLPYVGNQLDDAALYSARVGVSRIVGEEFVSEGALHLPEIIDRVRARPGTTDQALAFGANSIAWLTPGGAEWNATPVLAYYSPIALYRVSDNDDYVEVLQLGSSCKLRFAHQSELNQRAPESESEPFACASWPWAYGKNIVFSESTGVGFDAEHHVFPLSREAIADLTALRSERAVCLYSEQPVQGELDFAHLPPADSLRCYTRPEYQAVLDKALQ